MPAARVCLVLALVLPAAVTGCAEKTSLSPISVAESFGEGLAAWDQHSELSGGASQGDWSIATSQARSTDANASLELTLDAREQAGGIWITRTVEVPPSAPLELSVSLDTWSRTSRQAPGADLLVRIGATPPTSLGDFPDGRDGQAWGTRIALDEQPGWQTHTASSSLPRLDTGQVAISIGLEARESRQLAYHVDDLSILMVPEPVGGGTGNSPV